MVLVSISGYKSTGSFDNEVGKLVLNDDGHFLGVLAFELIRNPGLRMIGLERDVEMVFSGKTLAFGNFQSFDDDVFQRLFNQFIVVDFG